jgi:hypothetical protein
MNRSISVVCIALLGTFMVIGAATSRTPAHAVAYGAQVPDGLCAAYATYLAKGQAPIELAELVCPLA